MREMEVLGVRVELPGNAPLLLLRELGGTRCVPIWIGAAEASAIANAMEGVQPSRPLTHDLLCDLVTDLGHEVFEVRITELVDGTYYAELQVDGHIVSARPSDAVAVAVRLGVPVMCADAIIDDVGVELPEKTEDEVEKFREFLDSVNPDDFELGEGGAPDPGETNS
ncbi:bifunctional nuclease family protein [Propionicicella superfundia]|uniref:bifunctional nuclease family protein n=1 Tax=Propionicicella superfundia TaxID=348582 RepID=UPI0004138B77|nr:bifunctional nuclease family protein [Propionicicella superfundia]